MKPRSAKRNNTVKFVKPGQKIASVRQDWTGLLHLTNDWVLLVDLEDSPLVFPFRIAATSLRPDIVIYSLSLRRVIILELTCPCEENMIRWHSWKFYKYSALLRLIKKNRWGVDFFAIEVGARGYSSTSLLSALKALGFSSKFARSTVKDCGVIAMKCSFAIWLARESKIWDPSMAEASVNITADPNCLEPDSDSNPQQRTPHSGEASASEPSLVPRKPSRKSKRTPLSSPCAQQQPHSGEASAPEPPLVPPKRSRKSKGTLPSSSHAQQQSHSGEASVPEPPLVPSKRSRKSKQTHPSSSQVQQQQTELPKPRNKRRKSHSPKGACSKASVPKNLHSNNPQINPTGASQTSTRLSKHVGFRNLGNTCYISSILKALSVVTPFWMSAPPPSGQLSPLLTQFSSNISLSMRSHSPVDPSYFLIWLKRKADLTKNTKYDIKAQQDAPEVLEIVLDELIGTSPLALNHTSLSIQYEFTCEVCSSSSIAEESHQILRLEIAKSLNQSIVDLLKVESMCGENCRFCFVCNNNKPASKITRFSKLPNLLIIHVKRFRKNGNRLKRDYSNMDCVPGFLSVPLFADDSVSLTTKYKLVSQICHTGNFSSGHYWAHIYDSDISSWLKCDDTTVSTINEQRLNNNFSYVLFFEKCQ